MMSKTPLTPSSQEVQTNSILSATEWRTAFCLATSNAASDTSVATIKKGTDDR